MVILVYYFTSASVCFLADPGPNRPTSFDLNFTAIRKDMLSSWQDNIPFDRTFYADNTIGNSVCGYFRGTQVDCFKSKLNDFKKVFGHM